MHYCTNKIAFGIVAVTGHIMVFLILSEIAALNLITKI